MYPKRKTDSPPAAKNDNVVWGITFPLNRLPNGKKFGDAVTIEDNGSHEETRTPDLYRVNIST
jgi:hypothetical protein